MIRRYLSHWLNATDQHSLHGPFIYDFYASVIQNQVDRGKLQPILELRDSLLKDQSSIEVSDYGTGKADPNRRTISSLARTSNQPKISRLLFKIAARYHPMNVLELGTSLGLGTLHLATAAPKARIITMEGCPETAKKAISNFTALEKHHIELLPGPIEKNLDPLLKSLDQIDLLFIDANHQYQATIDYFSQCVPKLTQQSVVVIDDIHWSTGMEKAWNEIVDHPEVSISIDLFQSGVLFFHKNLDKSHYILSL